mgnify:CR=1 FL=1
MANKHLRDALILESLRALHRDIPRVLASAKSCDEVNKMTGENAGCRNIDLDDIMLDYGAGFDRYIAPAFQLRSTSLDYESIKRAFVDKCDPASSDAGTKNSHHATKHGRKRTEGVKLLRYLDAQHLNGTLSTAEQMLLPLIMRPE